jgi:virulence factor Mce-like protein
MGKSKVKYSSNEVKVGIFILVPSVILILLVLLKLGYSVSSSTMDVYLKIDSIKSIKKGTLVKVKGYEIGSVVEIRPVYKPALHFLAVMRIKKGVELYDNCSAVIQNQNIIGDSSIEIQNPDEKVALLQNGDVVEGYEYVSLDSVITNVNTLLTKLQGATGTIDRAVGETNTNLRGLMDNLGTSVNNLNALLNGSQKDILVMIASFRKTAKTLEEVSQELKKHPVKFLFKE